MNMNASEELHARHLALSQSCHDFKGEASAGTVLARARDYYDFLSGDTNKPEKVLAKSAVQTGSGELRCGTLGVKNERSNG